MQNHGPYTSAIQAVRFDQIPAGGNHGCFGCFAMPLRIQGLCSKPPNLWRDNQFL